MVSQPIVWLIVGVSLFVATPVFLWGCYALVLSTFAIRNAVWLRRATPITPDEASTGRVLLEGPVRPPEIEDDGVVQRVTGPFSDRECVAYSAVIETVRSRGILPAWLGRHLGRTSRSASETADFVVESSAAAVAVSRSLVPSVWLASTADSWTSDDPSDLAPIRRQYVEDHEPASQGPWSDALGQVSAHPAAQYELTESRAEAGDRLYVAGEIAPTNGDTTAYVFEEVYFVTDDLATAHRETTRRVLESVLHGLMFAVPGLAILVPAIGYLL